jgi:hypothetical protein
MLYVCVLMCRGQPCTYPSCIILTSLCPLLLQINSSRSARASIHAERKAEMIDAIMDVAAQCTAHRENMQTRLSDLKAQYSSRLEALLFEQQTRPERVNRDAVGMSAATAAAKRRVADESGFLNISQVSQHLYETMVDDPVAHFSSQQFSQSNAISLPRPPPPSSSSSSGEATQSQQFLQPAAVRAISGASPSHRTAGGTLNRPDAAEVSSENHDRSNYMSVVAKSDASPAASSSAKKSAVASPIVTRSRSQQQSYYESPNVSHYA